MADPVELLKKLVKIQSISADPSKRNEALEVARLIKSILEGLGAETKLVDNEVEGLNPLLLAKLGDDPDKLTLVLYSHYDVQPALKSDGWDREPFEPIIEDGYFYARGASDDKGPLSATLTALQELKEEGDFPINFRFIYEGEEESSSGGFEQTLARHREWIGSVDGIVILDTAWFSDELPGMDYGFRGLAYMGIEIRGPVKDVHSGLGGGIMREPMTDLIHLMSQLIDSQDRATIPGFYDDVAPLNESELERYRNIPFDIEQFRESNGLRPLLKDDPVQILMDNWRNPSISFHGIEGAFYEKGAKTVIPAKVIGKVSMRLVPNQDPEKIADLFKTHVENLFAGLNSPNELNVYTIGTGDWWYGDPESFLYKTGESVLEEHWGNKPTLTRSGGSIPIIPFMEKLFGAPAVAIGIGQNSDGAHSQNERIRLSNLIGGKEVLKKYFSTISKR